MTAAPAELPRVRRYAEVAAIKFGLGRSDRWEFVFAVNEAVTNAIRHGRPDAAGTIGVTIDSSGDTLVCAVSDSGDFQAVPAESDPLAERGRGFTFMTRFTDELDVSTSRDGTTVRLHKRRRPDIP